MVLTQPQESQKFLRDCETFPYHYGSYATSKEPSRSRIEKNEFPYHYGSYATCKPTVHVYGLNSFHTTMVLTQPVVPKKGRCWLYIRFHTTMVLTQQDYFLRGQKVVEAFPYHYGSYATKVGSSVYVQYARSFHTTMVLTQLVYDQECVLVTVTFPYHYGSYATVSFSKQ